MNLRNLPIAILSTTGLLMGAADMTYVIETVAGTSLVGDGGPAISAPLSDAQGVAVDRSGNLYIADANGHRVRKVAPSGIISTAAGTGIPGFRGDNGSAESAQLNTPYGVTVDSAGNLYIADLGNNRVRRVTPSGVISTIAGNGSEGDGGNAVMAQLLAPRNLALDDLGNLYVAEFDGHRIRKITPDGTISTVAGTGVRGFGGDGSFAVLAQLASPAGLAFDRSGALYIADSANHRVRKISGGLISTVVGTGEPGSGLPSQLDLPTGVAVDGSASLYISDSGNRRIRKLTAGGVISTIGVNGRDVAIDPTGNLYIAGGQQIIKFTNTGAIVAIAGDGSFNFRGDGGLAASARLRGPAGIALDQVGNLFIADESNHRVRRALPGGIIGTVAGNGTAGGSADGINAIAAPLSFPSGVAADLADNLYIADKNNDRIRIVRTSGLIGTVAGSGSPGFSGDASPATSAQLMSPAAIAIDVAFEAGTLYVADTGNNRIRKVSPAGIITTVAGNGVRGYGGDGGASTAAQLNSPRGICVDTAGNLYIADTGNHRIRKVTAGGVISTVAGTGSDNFGGDGGFASGAQLSSPRGVAVDASGTVYIADTGNHRIRLVSPQGLITTVAGSGIQGFSGDRGAALAAQLNYPAAVAVDGAGNIFIADQANDRIRKLTQAAATIQELSTQAVSAVNAASLRSGPVAPGEIISIFGSGIGPSTPQNARLNPGGIVDNMLAETQVRFDGRPAALFYVQESQINAQVPYGVAGQTATQMEIAYKGAVKSTTVLPVADAAPGIFSIAAGTGLGVIVNQDGTLNSELNPASRGSIVTVYATGEGLTRPIGIDGKISTEPIPRPVLPVSLYIGVYTAEILFAGSAPGFAGLLQINARLPGGFAPSGMLPLLLAVGSVSSQPGVVIAVR